MNDFRLSVLKPRYEELFASCRIRSSWLERITWVAQEILNKRSHYNQVEAQTSVPWWFVGILHYRLNFQDAHLHNGDPLTGRTVNSPPGRPFASPANGVSYTWIESAADALREKKFDTIKDRSIPAWLWRFEIWDGFNYAAMGLNSEYLWNGTNHFGSGNNRGKFLKNGSYDPNAQSDQVGAAAILWYLYHQGMINSGTPQASQTPTLTSVGVPSIPNGTLLANTVVQQTIPPLTALTTTVDNQIPLQLLDVLRYYQKLPNQDLALTWLQQQLPPNLLEEFAQRWRTNQNPVVTPMIQQSFVQPVVTTETKSVNQAVLDAAISLKGMSSAEGPGGGNLACAWTLNRVLKKAGIPALGDNPNYVPSLVQALKGGRGQLVSRNEAKAGDLVIAHREAHVGIGLNEGCKRVLSNSSSKARFVWESGTDFDGYYGGASTIYRLVQ